MVLAATSIPVELRPPVHVKFEFSFHDAIDAVENIAAYVPVGIVFASLGPLRATLAAAAIALFAETSQLFMMHRQPSVVDLATNAIGAMLGTLISSRREICLPGLLVCRWTALIAATLALALVLGVWAYSGEPLSTRGSTSPGTLEAYWKLDESGGSVALDSSGHGLDGRFRSEPKRVAGIKGGAVKFDGEREYIDFGRSMAFRLTGSMTISAWINPTSFPADDAAIVSNHNGAGLGYQLDTTVDRGPRTIGFKLADACGNLMARYGATPLVAGAWYHVAGVYDAEAKTLDVYLNGKLNNGFLAGEVTGRQRSSREAVYVGRRSSPTGFEFAGSIEDVRIYSLALTKEEIASDMWGAPINGPKDGRVAGMPAGSGSGAARPGDPAFGCTGLSDSEDARIPGAAAAFGVLVAVACVGLWPSAGPWLYAFVSLAAGMFFLPAVSFTLPTTVRWMMPFLSFAGGASVAVSIRRRIDTDR